MRGLGFAKSIALLLAPVVVLTVGGQAFADDGPPPTEGFQLELGVFGGGHFFADNLELGVADDPGVVPHPKTGFLGGLRLAGTMLPWLSLEGEVGAIPSADSLNDYTLFLLSYKLHALVHVLHGSFRPFLLAGVGLMQVASTEPNPTYTEVDKDTDFEFHGGVGVKYAVTNNIDVRADARLVFLPNTGKELVLCRHGVVGRCGVPLRWRGSAASAGAAATGERHRPRRHPGRHGQVPERGRGQGRLPGRRRLPRHGQRRRRHRRRAGQVPDEAETKNRHRRRRRLPGERTRTATASSVRPTSARPRPRTRTGSRTRTAAPIRDNDADGVVDANDKCPNEPETKNGYQDEDGCPDEVPAAVKKFTGVIKGINFKNNSADIQKSSFKLLAEAVKVMKEYQDVRIEISGHTSSEGDAAKNQKLSQDRADAVKAYLVSAGISGDRITSVGFGSDKPIGDNKTSKGREQNRRIEFRLLTADDAKAAPGGTGLEGKPAETPAPPPGAGAQPAPKLPPAGEPMPVE